MSSGIKASMIIDKRKWYQKIITVQEGNLYNNKSIMVDLPLVTIKTMDYFRFSFDIQISLEGVMMAISIPYLRIWIGKNFYHKFYRYLDIKTKHEKGQ